MTRKKSKDKDNQVEIDSGIYEKLAIMGMELGRDDVTEFINDMIMIQVRKEQEEEEDK